MSATRIRRHVRTLGWYARRPRLYRELLRRATVGRPSREVRALDRERGQAWAEEHTVDPARVLAELHIPSEVLPVEQLHPAVWREAHAAAERCPVQMGGPAHVDLLHHLCRYLAVERVVETGVAYGWSTLAILLAIEAREQGRLVSIDMPYLRRENDAWVGCVVPEHLRGRDRWTLVRKPQQDALPGVLRDLGTLDLAHYDSDKTYAGRMPAYGLLWQALRPGGVLMSDDIGDNLAFRDFAARVQRRPWVVRRPDGYFAGVLAK